MKYSYMVTGNFIFPRFLRHHYSNVFDVAFGAGVFNEAQMIVTGGKSRPVLALAVSLTVFSAYKFEEGRLRHTQFDWTDELCHFAGGAAYLAAEEIRRRKYNRPNTQLPKPQVT